jgi:hypothetical protein
LVPAKETYASAYQAGAEDDRRARGSSDHRLAIGIFALTRDPEAGSGVCRELGIGLFHSAPLDADFDG